MVFRVHESTSTLPSVAVFIAVDALIIRGGRSGPSAAPVFTAPVATSVARVIVTPVAGRRRRIAGRVAKQVRPVFAA
jgi:hypothetical protein